MNGARRIVYAVLAGLVVGVGLPVGRPRPEGARVMEPVGRSPSSAALAR